MKCSLIMLAMLVALSAVVPGAQAKGRGLIVSDGNSLVAGAECLPGQDFPTVMYRRAGHSFIERNLAVNGQTTQMMAADAATQIDPLYNRAHAYNVLVAWEIRNSFIANHLTPKQAVAEFAAYCRARRKAGFRVVVLTMLPTDSYDKPPGFDAARAGINANIRVHWRQWADGLADVAADRRIGRDGESLLPTYYAADHAHLNAAGQRIVASIVSRTVRHMLHRNHV